MDGLKIAASSCSFISLLLLIIALGSDYWAVEGEEHFGLWKMCPGGKWPCLPLVFSDFIQATRAFMVLGMLSGAASLFGLCASFYRHQIGRIRVTVLAVTASFAAGFCSLIAMAIFSGKLTPSTITFGWSFGLGWTSVVLFFITGGLASKAVFGTTAG